MPRNRARRAQLRAVMLILASAAAGSTITASMVLAEQHRPLRLASPTSAPTCHRFASPTGSDGASGSQADPYRSAQRLAASLGHGQTGCLRAGTYASSELKITRRDITLTSYPGERATVRARLWVDASRVRIQNLNLDGRTPMANKNGPSVTRSDDVFSGDDITNFHSSICFILGDPAYGHAYRTVIENSRIHDCGVIPANNQEHGIYVNASTGAIIRHNWIYDNADHGIQLYPDSQRTKVSGNVVDGNGEGIVFGGDGSTASSHNLVVNNVISNSSIRWNVESYWPSRLIGRGNVLRHNCVFASNPSSYFDHRGGVTVEAPLGFRRSRNLIADPQFVDQVGHNYNLQSSSRCAAFIQKAQRHHSR